MGRPSRSIVQSPPPAMAESLASILSKFAGYSFLLTTLKQLIPRTLTDYFNAFWLKFFLAFLSNTIKIRIEEHTGGRVNEAYANIKAYLGAISANQKANNLKAEQFSESKSVVISIDEGVEIFDHFKGIKLRWKASNEKIETRKGGPIEKNFYVLKFHKKYREIVAKEYLDHVVKEGKKLKYMNRRRKLYTNKVSETSTRFHGRWSSLIFEHPATFDTVAMDPRKKQEIVNDLTAFRGGKDYYKSIGKPWKRGYLLYGPPGTGKSSMICAIANFMDYDIFDLELTSVKDNAELKELLIDTKGRSIIVIEDIDCSIDLTGKRDDKKSVSDSGGSKTPTKTNVTLSGLLNVIDGIWSACGPERIIIFTTNHVKKLDPALIRRGRMDMHIEMSYCTFEAFKVLAKNYLGIDTHPLFEVIEVLLEVKDVSPCDVAENLMPKTFPKDVDACLNTLIQTCKDAKMKKSKAARKDPVSEEAENTEEEPGKTDDKAEVVEEQELSENN